MIVLKSTTSRLTTHYNLSIALQNWGFVLYTDCAWEKLQASRGLRDSNPDMNEPSSAEILNWFQLTLWSWIRQQKIVLTSVPGGHLWILSQNGLEFSNPICHFTLRISLKEEWRTQLCYMVCATVELFESTDTTWEFEVLADRQTFRHCWWYKQRLPAIQRFWIWAWLSFWPRSSSSEYELGPILARLLHRSSFERGWPWTYLLIPFSQRNNRFPTLHAIQSGDFIALSRSQSLPLSPYRRCNSIWPWASKSVASNPLP